MSQAILQELDLKDWDKQKASQLMNLTGKKPVLLILGGSKGARSINQAVEKHLEQLLSMAEVIHITGQLDYPAAAESRKLLTVEQESSYHVYPYLHEIGAALAAADMAISRAGASTLGEYPQFGLPAILVPYPYAWRYQKVNADYLADHGAAIVLEDARLKDDLLPLVKSLLNDPQKLAEMRNSALSLAKPDAAQDIAEIMVKLYKKNEGRRASW